MTRPVLLTATEIGRELSYPIRAACIFTLVTFWILMSLVIAATTLGLWIAALVVAFLVVPAIVRYLMLLLEARARDRHAAPPGAESFGWTHNIWALFPLLPVSVAISLAVWLHDNAGVGSFVAFSLLMIAILPAIFIVLAITHSPLQSVNPLAIRHLLSRCGRDYVLAPGMLLLAIVTNAMLLRMSVPLWLVSFGILYSLFVVFAVCGAVIRSEGLVDEVELVEAEIDTDATRSAVLGKNRTEALSRAYAFASRGNRNGGLAHLYSCLTDDPEPASAWPWYFERMLTWQNKEAALVFAKRYLHELLADSEQLTAVKLLLRCRMVDASFQPAADDIGAAADAARACHNDDLLEWLRVTTGVAGG